MKKLLILILFILVACSSESDVEITRIDVQKNDAEGRYEELEMITDNKRIELLQSYFDKIKWQPKERVQMVRKEDVLLTLFLKLEENMPERLYEYRIWFNKDSAEIISNKENEGYGTLDGKAAGKLKMNLFN